MTIKILAMKKKKLVSIAAASLLMHASYAQLRIDSDFRTRSEIRHGYMQPAVDTSASAVLTSQRSRIGMTYVQGKMAVRLSVQDVRLWGEDDTYTATGTQGDSQSLQTAEAWLEYRFTDSLSLTLGRQKLMYDQERLLSARDWNQSGLFYDAAVMRWTGKQWQVDAGGSFNNNEDRLFNRDYYTDRNRFQTLAFAYMSYKPAASVKLSAIGLSTGYADATKRNSINYMQTAGGTSLYDGDQLWANAEAYYQYGHNNQGKQVSAYMASVSAKYKLFGKKMILGLGSDFLSGNDAGNTSADYKSTDHAFDPLYGARFKYYGNMTMFAFANKPAESAGLHDTYAGLTLKPTEKHMLTTDVHYFRLANIFPDKTTTPDTFVKADPYLGTEIDVVYTYQINKWAQASIGGGYFAVAPTLEQIKGTSALESSPSYFAWASLRFRPELFNSKQ